MTMDIEDKVVIELMAARMALVYANPLVGEVALSLNFVILENPGWCKTFAVDGRSIYAYRGFLLSLYHDAGDPITRQNGRKRLMFILAHEVWHVIFQHLIRRGNRPLWAWRMAVDYIVNYFLVAEKIGMMPDGALYDRRFHSDMLAEEICDKIVKLKLPPQEPLDIHMEPGDVGDVENPDDKDRASAIVSVANDDTMNTGEIRSDPGLVKPRPLTAKEASDHAAETRAMVVRAHQNDRGSLPGVMQREIENFIAPKMDWKQHVDATLRSVDKSESSYAVLSDETWASWRYHRSRWTPDCEYSKTFCAILPSQDDGEKIRALLAFDTSLSVTSKMIREALSEVEGIVETFPDYELLVLCFDVQVYNPKMFTPQNIDELSAYRRAKIEGGGGTWFPAVYAYAEENGFDADRIIIFSDGLPNNDDWGSPDIGDTLFVINNKDRSIRAPFGVTVQYE